MKYEYFCQASDTNGQMWYRCGTYTTIKAARAAVADEKRAGLRVRIIRTPAAIAAEIANMSPEEILANKIGVRVK